ncbi:MAG: M42 family peptidase [Candidatus Aenigmarchaeota archaeon]|nr:M42 family peptidase [Candidatus Aenigmarchaeota archaeon]NIP39937.1 M42 family peptidase [Candidatus Aenigmarchaeota archaeon]NIQ17656.1 M42 family peptidase [Candidatus Aenigmarchaeota archaeon]NIS72844.1 M42 family peptidase [Candidatus Aenigmarchaeota archaeon]
MEDLLKKLVESPSVSGSERNVRDLIMKEIKPHVDDVRIDKIGNLIAKKGSGSPKIMINAHMDEIGLMVKHIDDKGFIRFEPIGGWDSKILQAQKFKIHGSKGPIIGVVGSKAIHLQEREEEKKVTKIKDMFIDIGANNKKEVEKMGVKVGDFVTQHGEFNSLGGSRVTGYGFDDRVGCLELIDIVKSLKKFKGTLYAVGTVKEEIGLIGIRGSTFSVNPDLVISLDVTFSGDVPYLKPHEAIAVIGNGPVLLIKDALSIIQDDIKKWVEDVAKKNKIPLQYDVLSAGATDSSIVSTIREGIPSLAILTPSRYMHTPVEVADIKDVKNAVKLVTELVNSAHKYL